MRKFLIIFGFLSVFLLPAISFATTYGPNFLTGGSCTADTEANSSYLCGNAFDNNTGTRWASTNTALPHWISYNLGTSTTALPARLYIMDYSDASGGDKDWQLYGSNNGTNFYQITNGTLPNDTASTWQTFDFTPTSTPYQYFKLNFSSTYRSDGYSSVVEWQMMEETTSTSTASSTTVTSVNPFALFPLLVGFCFLGYGIIPKKKE